MDESATARLKLSWTANFVKGKPLKLNQIFWAKTVTSGYRHLPWKPGVRGERFSVQDIAQTYLKHGGKNYTNDRWHFNVPVRLASRLISKDLKSLKRIRKVIFHVLDANVHYGARAMQIPQYDCCIFTTRNKQFCDTRLKFLFSFCISISRYIFKQIYISKANFFLSKPQPNHNSI